MKRTLVMAVSVMVLMLNGCGDSVKKKSSHKHGHGHSHDHAAPHDHHAHHGGLVNEIGGTHHVEFVVDQDAKKVTLFVLGEDARSPAPIKAQPLSLQAKPEGSSEFVTLALQPVPRDGEGPDKASRFEAVAEQLAAAKAFEAILRITVENKQYRTAFQVVPGVKHLHGGFRCPMDCEKGKLYEKKGACPVCKMQMAETKHGELEHADHEAKHGGIFFMAADNWHHLEGVMASPTEFRLYLYDNFTKPITVEKYKATADVVPLDAKGDEIGKPAKLTLQPANKNEYLAAAIPAEMKFPLALTVRVTLKEGERPALFNFTFDKVSTSGDHKH
jgi:uncharacterized protein YceK